MTNFEHGKLTLTSYKADDDSQRVEVLRLNPFFMKPLPLRYMLKIRLESEVVGRSMEKKCLCQWVPSLGSFVTTTMVSSVTKKRR